LINSAAGAKAIISTGIKNGVSNTIANRGQMRVYEWCGVKPAMFRKHAWCHCDVLAQNLPAVRSVLVVIYLPQNARPGQDNFFN